MGPTISAPPVTAPIARVSRAVDRPIDPGSDSLCVGCSDRVKFVARSHGRQVIANVYEDEKWRRVEHYHAECYDFAGLPYGVPR